MGTSLPVGLRVTTPEEEAEFQRKLYVTRKAFAARVKAAIKMPSPTRRRALYESWRKEFGDDIARESAKYAEACLAGSVSIDPFIQMIKEYESREDSDESLF